MIKKMLFLLVLAAVLAGCAAPAAAPVPTAVPTIEPIKAPTTVPAGPAELRVMVHDSFSVSENLVTDFEKQNNAKVIFIKSGDAGMMLNKAILTKDAPLADVIYGFDNALLSRALAAGLLEPYASPLLADVSEAFKMDPELHALPVDFGDVCINYDRAFFTDKNLVLPQSLDDLLKPEYRGLLVVENPAGSSPGLAFMLVTIANYGPEGYLDYWRALKANGVVIAADWETAYYTHFSGSSGKGAQPMVVSYGSSPAAEVIYASAPLKESPTASIVAPKTCFRQVEFAGILKGTTQRALAEKFMDWMLSTPFQEDLTLQMFVYPVSSRAQLPNAFKQHAQIPAEPASLTPADISAGRDAWVEAWVEAILR